MPSKLRKSDGTFVSANDLAAGSVEGVAVASTAALTSAALTDSSGGTANTAVQAVPDVTTAGGATPASTDVDAAVNGLLPAVRNNFADVTAQHNALRADVTALRATVLALLASLRAAGTIDT